MDKLGEDVLFSGVGVDLKPGEPVNGDKFERRVEIAKAEKGVHGEFLITVARGPMSRFGLSFPRMSFLTIRPHICLNRIFRDTSALGRHDPQIHLGLCMSLIR